MRLPLVVNLLLVVAAIVFVIGFGLFTNLLAVPGGIAFASQTPPPNTGPIATFTPSATPFATATPLPTNTSLLSPGGTYTVESGDNLTLIANKYGISVSALIAANPQLVPPDYVIHVGDVLNIPDPAAACDGYQAYVVKSGDFLVKIGDLYGVSATDIADFNGLPWEGRHDYADIRPGDLLCIPGPGWTPLRTPVATAKP